ncbi:hypothetical protein V6N11_081888 [Hibiscus sabdariffa]|uniref:Uncharacterized protein n=1 Tax=Hibiscus sabdariffa TaxID=183260 RepID=A0ABR2Q7H1_9ROSI
MSNISPIQHVSTSPEFSGCATSEQPIDACVFELPASTSSESPGCAASEQAAGACMSEQHVLNPSALHEDPDRSHSVQDDGESVDISAPLSSDALNIHPMSDEVRLEKEGA